MTHPQQSMILFREHLLWDGQPVPLGPILTVLQLFGAIAEEYSVTLALLYTADESHPMLLTCVQQRIKVIAAFKCRSATSGI